MTKFDALSALQRWYSQQCDGDWEHQYGVKLDTLDNPGWSLTVDLNSTKYENKDMLPKRVEHDENDWLFTYIKDSKFEARCGPQNLTEALTEFLNWIEEVS